MAPGIELGAAYVSLTVSAKGIASDLRRELGDPAEKAGKDAGKAIEDGIGGGASRGAEAAKAAIAVIGSAAILSGLNKAKDAASNLQQAVGGTAAVFGEAGDAIDEFAQGAADSVGLSERAAREITSQIGASLKGFGFAVDEAADKSIELVNIGADLAATFGGTTADAVSALAGALRGEFDPLERFGIALRQSSIDAKAVELGLAATTTSVDAHARAQAAMTLILEQSSGALGQNAREADTAAGQAQRAAAKQEEAAASLGEQLLPIYAKISEVVGNVADVFGALPSEVQTGILALAGIVIVVGPLTNVVGLVQSLTVATTANTVAVAANATAVNSSVAVNNLYAASAARSAASARLFSAALKVGAVALAGYAIGASVVSRSREEMAGFGSELAEGMRAEIGSVETYAEFVERLQFRVEEFNAAVEDANTGADIFHNDDLREITDQTHGTIDAFQRANEVIHAMGDATGDWDEATQVVNSHLDDTIALLDQGMTPAQVAAEIAILDRSEAEAEGTRTAEAFGTETMTAAEAAEELATQLSAGTSAIREFFGIQRSAVENDIAFRESLESIRDTGTSVAEEIAAGTANGQDRWDQLTTDVISGSEIIFDEIERLARDGVPVEEITALGTEMINVLLETADAAGLTTDDVIALRDQLGLTPENLQIQIDTNLGTVIADTQAAIDAFLEMQRVATFTITDTIHGMILDGRAGAHADGSNFGPGWNLFGEEGPELVNVGSYSGSVLTAAETVAAYSAGSSGGDTWYLNGIGLDEVAGRVRQEQRRKELLSAGGWG